MKWLKRHWPWLVGGAIIIWLFFPQWLKSSNTPVGGMTGVLDKPASGG